jgi:hypothetical protein
MTIGPAILVKLNRSPNGKVSPKTETGDASRRGCDDASGSERVSCAGRRARSSPRYLQSGVLPARCGQPVWTPLQGPVGRPIRVTGSP